MAIRNHWKKILLALFATMWAGCENEAATNAMPEYGCGPCGCDGNGCEVVPDYGAPYDPEDSSIYAPLYGVSVPDDSMVVDSMIVDQPALYGPPCVFNGTCGDESVTNEKTGQE